MFHRSQALRRISSIKSSLARRRWIAGLSTNPELVREATQGFTSMDAGWILALAERFHIIFFYFFWNHQVWLYHIFWLGWKIVYLANVNYPPFLLVIQTKVVGIFFFLSPTLQEKGWEFNNLQVQPTPSLGGESFALTRTECFGCEDGALPGFNVEDFTRVPWTWWFLFSPNCCKGWPVRSWWCGKLGGQQKMQQLWNTMGHQHAYTYIYINTKWYTFKLQNRWFGFRYCNLTVFKTKLRIVTLEVVLGVSAGDLVSMSRLVDDFFKRNWPQKKHLLMSFWMEHFFWLAPPKPRTHSLTILGGQHLENGHEKEGWQSDWQEHGNIDSLNQNQVPPWSKNGFSGTKFLVQQERLQLLPLFSGISPGLNLWQMCNGGAKGGRQVSWILWIVMDGSPYHHVDGTHVGWRSLEVGEQNDYILGFCRFRCGMVFSLKG